MKKQFLFIGLFIILTGVSLAVSFGKKQTMPPAEETHQWVSQQIKTLQNWYDTDWKTAVQSGHPDSLQKSFGRGRRQYKKLEWAIAYFFPTTAKDLNGAPLPEIEVEEHTVFEPSGFQVIEALIFPVEAGKQASLLQESKRLGSLLYRLQDLWQEVHIRDDQIWAAMRLDLIRMAALSLSGFDTPESGTSLAEMKESLSGLEAVLQPYTATLDHPAGNEVQALLKQANGLIDAQPHANSFDRPGYLQQFLLPFYSKLLQLQQALAIPVQDIHAVNLAAGNFFDSTAFHINFFTPDASAFVTREKISLGKSLFRDPILSSSSTVSCASCHLPDKAFADGFVRSRSFGAGAPLDRNTPSLFYAGLQQNQFYDMRAGFLEDQVKNVVENKDEIHGSLEEAAVLMNRKNTYRAAFRKALQRDSITAWDIQVVLASYVRSLAPFSSRFDRYMRGQDQLSKAETRGFNLFMGKAKCGTCHFMSVFNGTIPPYFTTTESEVIGVPADTGFARLSADSGRYERYKIPALQFAFKTPTLRNIALTAPYMHNGVFQTLEQVIDFYDRGGGAGRGLTLDHQTLPSDPLQLTTEEKEQLIRFLKTLTDTH